MAVSDRWTRRDPQTGRKVKTSEWGHGQRWLARWRDADDRQRKRSFPNRDAAEAFLADLRATPQQRASTRTVEEQWTRWIAAKSGLRQTTQRDYWQRWANQVRPRWGAVPLQELVHSEVAAWVGGLVTSTSPEVARKALLVLSGVVTMAAADGVVSSNPCAGIRAPKQKRADVRPLTLAQVERLAEECRPHELVVWTLTLTGIRFGELAALEGRDLDVTRGRLRVARSLTEVGGRVVVSRPKNGKVRDVPVTGWLLEQLAGRAGEQGPLLPTSTGGHWRSSAWKRVWVGRPGEPGARHRAEVPAARVHDLRHTAASLAIASGANIKAVQAMMGHDSATMTMDLYGHLMGDELDAVGAGIGRLLDGARARDAAT